MNSFIIELYFKGKKLIHPPWGGSYFERPRRENRPCRGNNIPRDLPRENEIYCRVPAGCRLKQTTLGSWQRQDTGPGILWSVHRWTRPTGEPPTCGAEQRYLNMTILAITTYKNLKKKRTIHLTHFTKTG